MGKYKLFNVWNALVHISVCLMDLMRKQNNAYCKILISLIKNLINLLNDKHQPMHFTLNNMLV